MTTNAKQLIDQAVKGKDPRKLVEADDPAMEVITVDVKMAMKVRAAKGADKEAIRKLIVRGLPFLFSQLDGSSDWSEYKYTDPKTGEKGSVMFQDDDIKSVKAS